MLAHRIRGQCFFFLDGSLIFQLPIREPSRDIIYDLHFETKERTSDTRLSALSRGLRCLRVCKTQIPSPTRVRVTGPTYFLTMNKVPPLIHPCPHSQPSSPVPSPASPLPSPRPVTKVVRVICQCAGSNLHYLASTRETTLTTEGKLTLCEHLSIVFIRHCPEVLVRGGGPVFERKGKRRWKRGYILISIRLLNVFCWNHSENDFFSSPVRLCKKIIAIKNVFQDNR